MSDVSHCLKCGDVGARVFVPVEAHIKSTDALRSSCLYESVLRQFNVEANPRYKPDGGKTFCNIFLWDVTRAMTAEIPYWVDERGTVAAAGQDGARRQNCNAMTGWLRIFGAEHGWFVSDSIEVAVRWACLGRPAVVMWHNPNGNGHAAILRPEPMCGGQAYCIQAGAVCYERVALSTAFGSRDIELWVHA